MVDFSKLLKRPAGLAKRPDPLPIGDYSAVVKKWEVGDQNQNKTPYARFSIGLTDWPDDMPEELKVDGDGKEINLASRQMNKDYFLRSRDEGAVDPLWRLDEFIRSCGIDPEGRQYDEILPDLIGQQVVVQVAQYTSQRTGEVGNQIGQMAGLSA